MSKQSWYGGENDSLPIRSNEVKRKALYGGPSASLLVTFLLGFAVGFFLCYALLEMRQEKPGKEAAATPAETPAEQTASESSAEQKAPGVEITASPVDPESAWPARHLIIGIPGTSLDGDTAEVLNQYKPGGIWLRESNTVDAAQIQELVRQINVLAAMGPELDMQPLIVAAQEGGEALNPLRLPDALSYEDLAKLETLDAIREAGKTVAAQSLDLGVGVLLAPVLDIFDAEQRDVSERPRFLGDTPETVSQAGIAYAEGLQEGGVLAVARHYPGIGSAILQEEDVPLIAETNVEKLASTMMPFLEAAAYDISGILISSAGVPALDVQVPGRPATLSPVLVREVFRNKWGYSGVLLAEDIHTVFPWSGKPVEEDVVAALAAGCDAVLISAVSAEEMARITEALKQALDNGTLDKENLLASRQRLDLWRSKLARASEGRAQTPPATAAVEGEAELPAEGESSIEGEAEGETVSEAVEGEIEGEIMGETAPEPESVEEGEGISETEPEPAPETAPEAAEEVTEPNPEEPTKPAAPPAAAPPEGASKVEHRIKQGETLTGIAKKYDVSVKDIMSWNGMTDGDIKFGNKLEIYTTVEAETPPAVETPVPEPKEAQPEVEAVDETPPSPEPSVFEAPATAPEEKTGDTSVPEVMPLVPGVAETAQEETTQETYVPEQIPPAPEAPLPPAPELPTTPLVPDTDEETPPNVPSTEPPTVTKNFSMRSSAQNDAEEDNAKEVTPPPEIPEPEEELPDATPATPEMSVTVVPVEQSITIEPASTVETAPEPVAAAETAPISEAVAVPPSEAEYTTHVIASGDNLSRVANKYGVTLKELMEINSIQNPDIVVLGTELKVPKP